MNDRNLFVKMAEEGLFLLKQAVFELLCLYKEKGLKNSEIGQALGIYDGFLDGSQKGWISRIILEKLLEDGKVRYDKISKKWFPV